MFRTHRRSSLNDLGVIKAEQGLPWDAARCFVRALRSSSPPCVSLVLGNLAYVLYLENRTAACASACDSALQLDPDDSRPHFLLSAVESIAYEGGSRPVCSVVRQGMGVQVFRLLRFEDQRMTTYHGKAVGEEEPRVRLAEPVPLTRPATPFGFLATYGDELWCGFRENAAGAAGSNPLRGRTAETNPVLHLPCTFYRVQRRRWVRVLATGGIARLEVRSFPPGVVPFEVEKLAELNLSGGGAAVRTVPQLPCGTEVTLILKLDDQEDLEVQARVSRIGRPQAAEAYSGLTFTRVDEKDRDKIARFINRVQLDRKRGGAHLESD